MEQDPVHRETFVALRARREACRLARALHNPPLDPYQFYCRHCGQPLDGLDLEPSDHVRCDACGCYTLVPPDSARELRRRRLRRWGRRPRSLLHDAVIAVYLLVALILVFAAL